MNSQLRQVNAQKATNGDQFSRGLIDFNWNVGGATVWHPEKSFFAITTKLSICDENTLLLRAPIQEDQICLSDNHCAGLFDNVAVKGGGQDISTLNSYAPQCHQLKQRLSKSKAFLDTMGKDVYGLDPSFKSRVNHISSDSTILSDLQIVNVAAAGFEQTRSFTSDGTGAVVGTNTDFDGTVAAGVANDPTNQPAVPKLKVGDIIVFPINARGYTQHVVETVDSATSITVFPLPPVCTNITGPYCVRDLSETNRKNENTTLWIPPLGIFDQEKLGAGDYRASLNPNSRFREAAIQSNRNVTIYNKDNPVGGSFHFEVLDFKLYIALSKDTVQLSGTESLFLEEQQIQSKPLTGLESSLDFSVPSSTTMLAFFIQSGASNTQFPPTLFKAVNNYDMSLESFQLTYANTSRPSTRWSTEFKTNKNTIQQRYHDTYSECQMSQIMGGVQNLSEYIEAGAIYAYRFDRDSSDKSTMVQLQIKMRDLAPNTNVVMCAWYNRTVELSYSNGLIVDIKSLSV